jgi:rhodanese-related sulfurtransferase
MKEIKVEEVRMMPRDSYELIDIRDDGLVAYGMIPEAIHISRDELEKDTNS